AMPPLFASRRHVGSGDLSAAIAVETPVPKRKRLLGVAPRLPLRVLRSLAALRTRRIFPGRTEREIRRHLCTTRAALTDIAVVVRHECDRQESYSALR
ncbi:MAG: hypothetical protein ACXVH7_13775, partial [Thermoanaerobaculia bacterium]